MRRDPAQHVARALAWGFLAAPEWTDRDLVASAVTTLGYRYRWMKRVVRPVMATYHRPPVDRPEALSRFVLTHTPLRQALADQAHRGAPTRVRQLALAPASMGRQRWPVPPIEDLASLADLLDLPLEQLGWAADTRGLQRRAPPGPLHLYRHQWVQRPGAVPRLLESPTPLLRAVLRRVLQEILVWVPVHPAAHGFVRGRSAVTNATAHLGASTVLCLDLQTFFATITANRVNGIFRSMGYPASVAWTLTALCTHQTPVHVLSEIPTGGDSSQRYLLRSRLRSRHLPQGAATSPALANLACFGLDQRLARYAAAAGLTYTRYADDLTFSGPQCSAQRLVSAASAIVREEGFALNTAKTRVRGPHQRHEVTGVVVNERPNVPREYYDQLRAVLHDAHIHGVDAANRDGHPDFRRHLDGRIGWVESLNAGRGARLRAQYDAVIWPI
ncbi:MAG: reverse transcriptase family protein [Allobranchiibius sp.]